MNEQQKTDLEQLIGLRQVLARVAREDGDPAEFADASHAVAEAETLMVERHGWLRGWWLNYKAAAAVD